MCFLINRLIITKIFENVLENLKVAQEVPPNIQFLLVISILKFRCCKAVNYYLVKIKSPLILLKSQRLSKPFEVNFMPRIGMAVGRSLRKLLFNSDFD